MNIPLFHSLVAAVLTLIVGCFPYFYRRNNLTKLFALSNFSLALCNFADIIIFLPITHEWKLILYRMSYLPFTAVVWTFYPFMIAFGRIDTPVQQKIWRLLKIAGTAMIVLSFTPWLVRDISETVHPWEIPGPLYPFFILYLTAGLGIPLYLFYRRYKIASGEQQNQMRYMFLALVFGLSEAILFFIATYVRNISSSYFYLQFIYSAIVAYAIVAHHVMDINIIIRKTVIYSLLTGALTAVYLGLGALFLRLFEQRGVNTYLSSVIAIGAVAILSHPLRMRIQRFVDRHFFRETLDRELLRQVTSGFVHEIKRPLAQISLPAELALMDLRDLEETLGTGTFSTGVPVPILQKLRQRLEYILNQSIDAGYKIEAIRGISTEQKPEMKPLALKDVIQSSVSSLGSLATQWDVSIQLDIPDALPPVRGNRQQLQIAFTNLLKNALEAMSSPPSPKPEVGIRAWAENESVCVSVQDSGHGILHENLRRLFEPYFSTKGPKGMGMGLYLVQQIVEAHQGRIEVKSEEGKGTEFTVRLPKAEGF